MTARSDTARGGAWQAARLIYCRDGLGGFWRGTVLDVVKASTSRGLTMGIFDVFQRSFRMHDGVTGMLTGVTVTLLTHPIEVVQTGRRSAQGSAFLQNVPINASA